MSDIPYEILMNIFSRVSVRYLFQFRCVCKTWRDLLSDPHFIKQHLNRSLETSISSPNLILNCGSNLYHVLYSNRDDTWDAQPVNLKFPFKLSNIGIVGSCNGLVCLLGFTKRVLDVIVWNPFTGDLKKLPFAQSRYPNSRFPVMGFGYSRSKNQYKVIRVIHFPADRRLNRSSYSLVEVHTLGSGSWREIGKVPIEILGWSSGTFINGSLHWIANSSSGAETIVSFNIGVEKLTKFPRPYFGDNGFQSKLEVLGGFLSMICTYHDNLVKIWVMKDYGVKESWIKLFSISQPMVVGNFKCLKPLGFKKSGEILLEMHDRKLILYDPRRKTFRTITILGAPTWSEVGTFVGTLISPNSCN